MSEEPKKRPVQNDRDDRDIEGFEIDTGNGIHAVADLPSPSPEHLDEDERMLRMLRIDLASSGSPPSGIVSVGVSDRFPKREFFRSHLETIMINLVDHAVGMEVEYHAVVPEMIAELASIGIDALPFKLFFTLTAEGGHKIVPVRQGDIDGSINEWTRTKEVALARAQQVWVRVISDRVNGRYRVFEAPPGRFPEPVFPDMKWPKLVRLAFTDRGRLIDSVDHPLFRKWSARDGD